MATLRIGKLTASGNLGNSATLRIKSITAAGTVPQAGRLRIPRINVAGTTAPGTSTLRVNSIQVAGTSGGTARLRFNRLTSVQPLALKTIQAKTVEPFDAVSVAAIPVTGSPAPSVFEWRQISGPDVILSGAGDTRAFVAPALKDGTVIVLGVRSQDASGNFSAEVQATITVYPHTIFGLVGGVWKGLPFSNVPIVVTPPAITNARLVSLKVTGTVPASPATPVAPTLGTTVTDHGKTYTWDLAQNFTTDAAVGSVRTAYPSMGYFNPGQGDTANKSTNSGGSTKGIYDPDQTLSVSGGYLTISQKTAVPSASAQANGAATTPVPMGACVMPDNYQSRLHGVWEVRYKTTANKKGYKFVGIWWPTNDVWNQGEIDWPEADLTETSRPANAVPGSYSNGNMTFVPAIAQYAATDTSDFHTARTVWNSDGMYFYWDGTLVASITDVAAIPTQPMRIELQAETFINQGPVPADAVGSVIIDYVAAAS